MQRRRPGPAHAVSEAVIAKVAKWLRAESIAQPYARRPVDHAGKFPELEDQMPFNVHRALHLARAHGVATPLFSTLQRGYFAGELNPLDKDELVQIAAEGRSRAEETHATLASLPHCPGMDSRS